MYTSRNKALSRTDTEAVFLNFIVVSWYGLVRVSVQIRLITQRSVVQIHPPRNIKKPAKTRVFLLPANGLHTYI